VVPTEHIAKALVARVNDTELAYQTFGSGGPAPAILLHGGFGSVETFGPNIAVLAAGRLVIGVDLQSHGRTPAVDRPMRFETMADDVAALIDQLGLGPVDVVGFSLGGGVALRMAIQHPDLVRKAALVSTPYRRSGWHPDMLAGMDSMGPETAEPMKQTPLYSAYSAIAPRPSDWGMLVTQVTSLLKVDYNWTDGVRDLRSALLIVAGDADGLAPRHAVDFFELLGGGQRDAHWDRSGMTKHRLAILPGTTHYEIAVLPLLGETISRFLDEA
jgi:pimeloyl-ACP methyl ester carboxylesterase